MTNTQWAVAIRHEDTKKVELVTNGMYIDPEDPTYEFDIHIVPVRVHEESPEDFSFGAHTFERGCICHPEVREKIHGRNMIIHSDRVM